VPAVPTPRSSGRANVSRISAFSWSENDTGAGSTAGRVEPATTVPAVRTEGLTKRYPLRGLLPWRPGGYVDALRGVDVTVPVGSVHGIIGPNGSGKSTLLRILATLVLPDGGRAEVLGEDVQARERQVRSMVGLSTGEERGVYWRLTPRQNLEFAAALHHLRQPEHAIEVALARVRLEPDADRPAEGLSQGLMRRLGLARAVLHEPPLLLLDEPTRSLDPGSKDEFHAVLDELRRTRATTIVLTTHDLHEAADVCDTVTVLRDGRVGATVPGGDEAALRPALDGPA
jgi:ABC-2 type transport system ATP-binding protein